MLTSEFNFNLPKNLIAQSPAKPRDHARLLILDKKSGDTEHRKFYDIVDYLEKNDTLVLNNSKVIPARLHGTKKSGGKVEVFLLTKKSRQTWEVLVKGKIKDGQKIILAKGVKTIIYEIASSPSKAPRNDSLTRIAKFNCSDKKLFSIGETPLPPYIKSARPKRGVMAEYQTTYATKEGSVAAPTAGLHFTKPLLDKIKKKGINIVHITLHVGMGTFMPVKTKKVEEHQIHSELAIIDKKTASQINKTKGRVIAVGTTSIRTLEAFADRKGLIKPDKKLVDIFIYPGYKYKIVNAIITNFHLPESSLIMMISAFAGNKAILETYQEAIDKKYKFYSFGDGMLIK